MNRRTFFFALLVSTGLCALASAAPMCGDSPCVGPVLATYSGAGCNGAPVSLEQVFGDTSFAASPNTCATDSAEMKSRRYSCSASPYQGLTIYEYTSTGCPAVAPQVRSTKTTGVCFNGVKPTETRAKNTGSEAFSYALFCSPSEVATVSLQAAQSTGSPTSTANPMGAPWSSCPASGCGSAPKISFYADSACSGPTFKSLRLFQNVAGFSNQCYDVFANQTQLNIPAPLNANIVCTNAEMHVQYFANGCSVGGSTFPVYAEHYPIYNACVQAEAQSVYYKYTCG